MVSKRVFAAGLAACLLLTLSACSRGGGDDDQGTPESAGVAVQVETVGASTIYNANRVSGRVAAESQTAVMVGFNAQVTAVYVETGDTVRAGQRICTLDVASTMDSYNAAVISRDAAVQSYNDQKEVFDAQIASVDTQMALADTQIAMANTQIETLNAQIGLINSQIATAEKNLRDLEALQAIGAAAPIEVTQAGMALDQARLSLAQAQAGVEQAQAGVEQAQSQKEQLQLSKLSAQAQKNATLSQLEAGVQSYQANVDQLSAALENVDRNGNLLAPVTGTVLSLNAVEKGMVSATAPVAVIEEARQMKVVVSVSEALIPKIAVGDTVDVSVSAIGASYEGTVRNVERGANPQTGLYAVTVSVPDGLDGLFSGMFADVTFRTDTSYDALVVPTQAILTSGSTQYVFVVEDGAARYIQVTTGLADHGVTEVLTGLSRGQQLVTVGQSYLHDGDPVRIVEPEG